MREPLPGARDATDPLREGEGPVGRRSNGLRSCGVALGVVWSLGPPPKNLLSIAPDRWRAWVGVREERGGRSRSEPERAQRDPSRTGESRRAEWIPSADELEGVRRRSCSEELEGSKEGRAGENSIDASGKTTARRRPCSFPFVNTGTGSVTALPALPTLSPSRSRPRLPPLPRRLVRPSPSPSSPSHDDGSSHYPLPVPRLEQSCFPGRRCCWEDAGELGYQRWKRGRRCAKSSSPSPTS